MSDASAYPITPPIGGLNCRHCGGPQRGNAAVGDIPLCRPDKGLNCYDLVTVYGHTSDGTPCIYCDNPGWVRNGPGKRP